MQRSDYAYRALAAADYEAIVSASEMGGLTSPMHGPGNWQSLLTQSQSFNIDPRLALAAALWEDHDGTDPNGGVQLARVFNFSGIKWDGQSYAYDSGIQVPANEQPGTYAGFHDFGGWCQAIYMTLTNGPEAPYFNSGDLLSAWSVYITGKAGSANGQGRIDSMVRWQQQYAAPGGTPTDGIYGEDLIAKFETQIGHAYSGDYDANNGNHPWAYWCRAGVESTGRNCGLSVVAHTSAYTAQLAVAAQGLLVTDDAPEHGAVIQLDTRFYAPDGHTGLWNADRGQLLCTLTDGTGVGYRSWGPGTIGYAGWYRLPGIVAPYRAAPPAPGPQPSVNLVIVDNPYNKGVLDPMHQIGVGGANRRLWESTPYALQMLGYPMRNEQQAMVYEADGTSRQRTVQYYERNVTIHAPENAVPWDITVKLATQRVVPIGG